MDSTNIFYNELPEPAAIKIGTQVLFKQGSYGASNGLESGGYRWHEGVVTQVHKLPGGVLRFTGHHTKGVEQGKSVDFPEYQFKFERYSHQDLRLATLSDTTSLQFTTISAVSGNSAYEFETGQHYVGTRADEVDSRVTCNGHGSRECIDMTTKFYLEIGDRVIAEYKNIGRYYSATVNDLLSNSKYLVDWCDGDVEGMLCVFYLKPLTLRLSSKDTICRSKGANTPSPLIAHKS